MRLTEVKREAAAREAAAREADADDSLHRPVNRSAKRRQLTAENYR